MIQLTKNKRPMIIAIDFDGTLFDGFQTGDYYNKNQLYPTPLFQTLINLKQKYKDCLYYILYTCKWDKEELKEIDKMCSDKGLIFDTINENYINLPFKTSGKIYADLYLDNCSNGMPINNEYINNYISSILESDLLRDFY